ncbi:MAG: hypothetical protein ACRECO_03190 [Xanthobacteraceae bacterium]
MAAAARFDAMSHDDGDWQVRGFHDPALTGLRTGTILHPIAPFRLVWLVRRCPRGMAETPPKAVDRYPVVIRQDHHNQAQYNGTELNRRQLGEIPGGRRTRHLRKPSVQAECSIAQPPGDGFVRRPREDGQIVKR